jgi:hypothetical protein
MGAISEGLDDWIGAVHQKTYTEAIAQMFSGSDIERTPDAF